MQAAEGYGPFYRVHYDVPQDTKVLVMAETERLAEKLKKELSGLPYEIEIHPVVQPRFDVDEKQFDVIVMVRAGYRPDSRTGHG